MTTNTLVLPPLDPAAVPPERVLTERGKRSAQMITASIHSTRLPALGGCRITRYRSWQDGAGDAVRLSAAMTEKAALAGLHHGGGKTVVALEEDFARRGSATDRADLLADIGDVVESFGGRYVTGPDIAARGARLVVADVDESRRALAARWGATWSTPDEALVADVDVLVPCASVAS